MMTKLYRIPQDASHFNTETVYSQDGTKAYEISNNASSQQLASSDRGFVNDQAASQQAAL